MSISCFFFFFFKSQTGERRGGRGSHFNLRIPQIHRFNTSGKQSMAEGFVGNKTNWHSVALKRVFYTGVTLTFTKQGFAAGNVKVISSNFYYLEHYQTYIKAHSHIQNITTYCIYGAQKHKLPLPCSWKRVFNKARSFPPLAFEPFGYKFIITGFVDRTIVALSVLTDLRQKELI